LGIKYAVDCTNLPKPLVYKDIEYLYVRVDDSELFPIKKFFQSASDFIKKAKDSGSAVIVFCAAGVSRAATICMMYLVIHENLTLKEAYEEVVK
jgi:protein-tyrosine phosphatase